MSLFIQRLVKRLSPPVLHTYGHAFSFCYTYDSHSYFDSVVLLILSFTFMSPNLDFSDIVLPFSVFFSSSSFIIHVEM